MKVFISWSGARSRAVAELLHDWTKCVLQATRPWMSSRDIDRGSLWFTEINDQLKDTTVGIICLTKENMNKPWILFEAGALAKGLSSTRVCTLLVDLKPSDLDDPMAQFNHTTPDKEGLRSLVGTLNACIGAEGLSITILDQVFATYWEQFAEKFAKCLKIAPQKEEAEPKSDKELLAEILDNTRYLQNRVRRLESNLERLPDGRVESNDETLNGRINLSRRIRECFSEGLSVEGTIKRLAERGYPPELTIEHIQRMDGRELNGSMLNKNHISPAQR